MRNAQIKRETKETIIDLILELDGQGNANISTGVGFLDHMMELFVKHAKFDCNLICKGDIQVDDHHSVEDIAICLGKALGEALGTKKGIVRYGDIVLPMDEALILTAVDISGRGYLGLDLDIKAEKVGTFDTELVEEFLLAFVRSAGLTLHIKQLAGKNAHHIIEGVFKSLARALRASVAIDEKFKDEIPSTKGIIEGIDL